MNFSTNLLLYAIPLFVILSIAETIFLFRETGNSQIKKDFVTNVALGLGFIMLSVFTKSVVLYCYNFLYQYRFFSISNTRAWTWLLCFFADDFTYYWFHRISHIIRFFWASHVVHHSSQFYSFAAALRQTWTGNITGVFLFWGWMPLAGFDPTIIIVVKSISLIYQFFIHTERIHKLPGCFEYIFNTPSHHRVHHGSNEEYLDKNFGGILIIWDRMFGTYLPETTRPKYGLTKDINSNNIFTIAFYEWAAIYKDLKHADNKSDKWNYLFNKPGWKYEKEQVSKQTN